MMTPRIKFQIASYPEKSSPHKKIYTTGFSGIYGQNDTGYSNRAD